MNEYDMNTTGVSSTLHPAIAAPQRAAMITAGMEELAAQVEILDKSFAMLYEILAPILRPIEDSAKETFDGPRPSEDSDLAEGLRNRISQIQRIRRNIEGATARVDL